MNRRNRQKITRLNCLWVLLVLTRFAFAQGLEGPIEDEIDLVTESCIFCKPGVINKSKSKGVELAWTPSLSRNFVPTDATDRQNSRLNHVDEFKFKFKIPIVNAESIKALLGFEHGWDQFNFNQIGGEQANFFDNLDGRTLKYNKFTAYFTKSINYRYYFIFRVRASFNGDYDNFVQTDSRYSTYSATGIFGVKPSPDLEYGFGLSYSNGFNRIRVLPFGVYNRTFNEKWGIETILPVQILGRYNVDSETILLFGAEFTSRRYSIDNYIPGEEFAEILNIRNAGINSVVSLERKLFSWVWMNAKIGYHVPFSSRIDNLSVPEDSFRFRQGTHPFFKVGIFITPDKEFIK